MSGEPPSRHAARAAREAAEARAVVEQAEQDWQRQRARAEAAAARLPRGNPTLRRVLIAVAALALLLTLAMR